MLVLSRKKGETIVIDNRIIVRVLRCQGDKVKIGIEAAPEIPVMRGEISEGPTDSGESGHGATVCSNPS